MSNLILRTLHKRGLASNLIIYSCIKVVIAQVMWPFESCFIFFIYFYFLSLKTLFFIRHRRINLKKKLTVTVIMVSFQGVWSQDSEYVFGIRLAYQSRNDGLKSRTNHSCIKRWLSTLSFKSNNVMWDIKLKII